MGADHKHGFIHGVAKGTVSEHDGHHFDEALDQHNTGKEGNADKAYSSAQRREMLGAPGFKDGIERETQASEPLGYCQERGNPVSPRDGPRSNTCL